MLSSAAVVLTLVSFACGENPAVQVLLTNKGLQYGKHVGAGWIQDKLTQITLPDISGKVFGIHFTLTGTTITKCDFPEPTVEFYQNATGFKSSISGLSAALTGEWTTAFGLIHDSGTFSMALFSVDVTWVVSLGNDSGGHLSVTSNGCDALIGNMDIQLRGGASWIFKPILAHYMGRLKDEIQSKICLFVQASVVSMEHHLQLMNVSFDVDQFLTLDLPLTGSPLIDASSLNLGLKGEFYNTKTHKDPPFKAQPFTLPDQPGYMLSLGLSEYTVNSASYGYYSAGLLQTLINDSMIPPSFPVRLNTSSMGPFIPQLPKKFPGLLMKLQVYAREVPLFSFQPGAVKLNLKGAVKAFAIQPNGTQTPLFKLNVDTDFSGKVWIADGKLKGSMGMNNLTLTLASSEVGPFQTAALEKLAKMGSAMLMGKINAELGKGVNLPRMKQAELVNAILKMNQGFITISSDAQV
uniref:lipopolysaccharide-binding protein n=1 Tax=Scatophagus argus TaxID=75038 RepID=UPI001ED7DDF8|nr:lipopolysaccharide-binding protein [Scatophagus argus]